MYQPSAGVFIFLLFPSYAAAALRHPVFPALGGVLPSLELASLCKEGRRKGFCGFWKTWRGRVGRIGSGWGGGSLFEGLEGGGGR